MEWDAPQQKYAEDLLAQLAAFTSPEAKKPATTTTTKPLPQPNVSTHPGGSVVASSSSGLLNHLRSISTAGWASSTRAPTRSAVVDDKKSLPAPPNNNTVALRAFHNSVKRDLYTMYLRRGNALVEIGCGRGGDLQKAFFQAPSWWLNIDINRQAIDEGRRRADEQAQTTGRTLYKKIVWYCGDLSDSATFHDLVDKRLLCRPESVDLFSSQFSLTFFWKSRATFEQLLDWIYTFLKPGGYFIGTCPDGEAMIRLCREHSEQGAREREAKKSDDAEMSFTSPLLSIEIDAGSGGSGGGMDGIDGIGGGDAADATTFGRQVVFTLANSIVEIPTPEYLIHWPTFVACAALHNLTLIATSSFAECYKEYHKSNLSEAEMQAAFINRTFVFQKLVV